MNSHSQAFSRVEQHVFVSKGGHCFPRVQADLQGLSSYRAWFRRSFRVEGLGFIKLGLKMPRL